MPGSPPVLSAECETCTFVLAFNPRDLPRDVDAALKCPACGHSEFRVYVHETDSETEDSYHHAV